MNGNSSIEEIEIDDLSYNQIYTVECEMTTSIMLDEFAFYNKSCEIISEDDITMLKSRVKKKNFYWTTKELGKEKLVFFLYSSDETMIELHTLKQKITPEEAEQIVDIFQGFKFAFSLTGKHRRFIQQTIAKQYNYSHNGNDEDFNYAKMYKTIQEFFTEHFNFLKYKTEDFSEVAELWKLITQERLPTPKIKVVEDENERTDEITLIHKVKDVVCNDKNYRISIHCNIGAYYNDQYNCRYYRVVVCAEDNSEYNYMDEGILYLQARNDKNYYFAEELITKTESGKVQIENKDYGELQRNIALIIGQGRRVITKLIYNFYISEQERLKKFKLSDFSDGVHKIIEKYKKLLGEGREIKIGQFIITKTKIALDDESFVIEFNPFFFNVMNEIYGIREELSKEETQYNFNKLYEKILSSSTLSIFDGGFVERDENKNWIGCEFTVNRMRIVIERDADTGRVKINGIFCRIGDVFDILNKAICYNDIRDYNMFIKDVSHIGMTYKKLIANGVSIKLRNPLFHTIKKIADKGVEEIQLRFSLLWDTDKRSKVYLHLNGEKYLIKNKQKFKKHFNLPHKDTSIKKLYDQLKECLAEFPSGKIVEIVDNAEKEARIVKQRAQELLRITVEETNAQAAEIQSSGKTLKGYALEGLHSRAKFFIDGNSMDVYKQRDGRWDRRCVVDDPNKNRIFEDRLANRLVNIYNENRNISQIQG